MSNVNKKISFSLYKKAYNNSTILVDILRLVIDFNKLKQKIKYLLEKEGKDIVILFKDDLKIKNLYIGKLEIIDDLIIISNHSSCFYLFSNNNKKIKINLIVAGKKIQIPVTIIPERWIVENILYKQLVFNKKILFFIK